MNEIEQEIRQLIGWDIEAGVLPEGVSSWHDLKLHVDPDDYFGIAAANQSMPEPSLADRDAIRANLDEWLAGGRDPGPDPDPRDTKGDLDYHEGREGGDR